MELDNRPGPITEAREPRTLPKVSIGLPVHNGEKFLAAAIESVLAQEFTDFELLISDNASSDSTWEICRYYAHSDHRIRLYRNDQNIGAIANFILVLKKSTAPYFAWTAHDDVLHPRFLTRCIDFLDSHMDHVACFVRHVVITYETGQESYSQLIDQTWDSDDVVERYKKCLDTSDWPLGIYGVMRREALERITLSRTRDPDVVFVRELCLEGKVHQINEVLRYYREPKPQPDGLEKRKKHSSELLYGQRVRRESFPRIRAYGGLVRRIMRKPLPVRTKAKILYLTNGPILFFSFRHLYWDMVTLVRDLTYNYPKLNEFLRSVRRSVLFRIEPRHWRSSLENLRHSSSSDTKDSKRYVCRQPRD